MPYILSQQSVHYSESLQSRDSPIQRFKRLLQMVTLWNHSTGIKIKNKIKKQNQNQKEREHKFYLLADERIPKYCYCFSEMPAHEQNVTLSILFLHLFESCVRLWQ